MNKCKGILHLAQSKNYFKKIDIAVIIIVVIISSLFLLSSRAGCLKRKTGLLSSEPAKLEPDLPWSRVALSPQA